MADENIRIRAELEGALERDVQGASDAVDDLGRQATETAVQLRIMEAAASGAARQVHDLDREAKKADRSVGSVGKSAGASAKDTDKGTSALDRMQKMLSRFKGKDFDLGKLMSAYKIPAIVTALTLAATALSALGAAGVAAVAGLAPLVLLSAAMPAGMLASAQAMGAMKLATHGFTEAVSAMLKPGADPAAIQKAMDGLAPSAQRAAIYVAALAKGPLAAMQKATANAFFPGFVRGLQQATAIIPTLRENLVGTARVMGQLADEAGRGISSPLFQAETGRVMANNNAVILNGGHAAGSLAMAMLAVLDAFRPVLLDMSVYAERGAKVVQVSADAANQSGAMGRAFEYAWGIARGAGRVIADLVVGLFNIGRASDVMGQHLGGGIEVGARAFRDWTGSIEGQASLRNWFADAIPVVDAVVRLLGHVAVAFAGLAQNQDLVPVINQITDQLLPAVVDLAAGVSTKFGPALVTAATAFVQFQNALTFTPLAVILQVMATSVSTLVGAFSMLPGPVRTTVAVLLTLGLGLRALGMAGAIAGKAFDPLMQGVRGFRGSGTAVAGEMTAMGRAGRGLGQAFATVGTMSRDSVRYLDTLAAAAGTTASRTERATARMTGAWSGVRTVSSRAVGGLRNAIGGLSGALGGPWGIAITAATVGIGAFAAHQAQAKADVQQLTGTLNQQTGAITRNTLTTQLAKLQQKGWLTYAQQSGISLPTITAALRGNSAAMAEVSAKAGSAHSSFSNFFQSLPGGNDDVRQFKKSIEDAGGQIQLSQKQWRQLNDAMGGTGRASRKAAGGMDQTSQAERQLDHAHQSNAAKARGAAAATDGLTNAQRRLKSATAANVGGMIGFRQAIADANKAVTRGAHAMNLHTQAGRDNQTQMVQVATAAKGVTTAGGRQAAAVAEARRKITAWAQAAGYSKGKADAYARGLLGLDQRARHIPNKVDVKVNVNGTAAATRDANRVAAAMRNIPSAFPAIHVAGALTAANQAARVHSELQALQQYRFAGGPVEPGTTYTVGELGPEIYRDVLGRVEVVGAHGMEQRTFPVSGQILPNTVYEAAVATEARVPAALIDALDGRTEAAAPPRAPAGSGAVPFAPSPDVHLHFHPNNEFDVDAAARRAVASITRDEQERRIRHGQAGY